jgi:Divergent InlB B-repeat domain
MNTFARNPALQVQRLSPRLARPAGWRTLFLALCLGATSWAAQAQSTSVLKDLVRQHGSLVAGDVIFTNFRLPLLPANNQILGDTFPKLADGANVSVQASLAADGTVTLKLTPIDTTTGLPQPVQVDAKTGASLPTDFINYVEYDAIVSNPQRRLHTVTSGLGPGTNAIYGSTAFNWVYFFDAASIYKFANAAYSSMVNNVEIYHSGAVPLQSGDLSGARFAAHWGLNSADWGGIRIGSATLDSISIRYGLADAVAPVAPPAQGVSILFGDAVYLNKPAPAGGTTLTLASSDPSSMTVPASVTVEAGAFYSAFRAAKQPVVTATIVTVTGTYLGSDSFAQEWVWVGEAVGTAPLPTLSVVLTGKGKVTSFSRNINCGTVCSTTPVAGAANGWAELLTASAGSGATFTGWTGACSGTAPTCSVIVNGLVNVGATFTTPTGGGGGGGGGGATSFKLSVSKSNNGTVTSTPAGIHCGATCTATVAAGNAVALSALPPPGLAFLGWSGACSGTASTCTVVVNADTKVQANFSK